MTRRPTEADVERSVAEQLSDVERFVDGQLAANRSDEPVGSDRRLWTYGEAEPDRDHFTVWVRHVTELNGLGLAARHCPIRQRRYAVSFWRTLWCYEPPAGIRIETSEPDDWNGWRS